MTRAERAKTPGKALFWVGFVLMLIGIAPLLSAFFASWIAAANGCSLNEGSATACVIAGADVGGMLYTMFVMGWLMLLTVWLIPAGLVVLIVAVIQRLTGPAQSHASAPSDDRPTPANQ